VSADRVLFGSDYPLLSQDRALDQVISADLPAEAKDLILSGNAEKLLGIKGGKARH
jgi:predicted TIM-barrel fold metal-dependent hydrolase